MNPFVHHANISSASSFSRPKPMKSKKRSNFFHYPIGKFSNQNKCPNIEQRQKQSRDNSVLGNFEIWGIKTFERDNLT